MAKSPSGVLRGSRRSGLAAYDVLEPRVLLAAALVKDVNASTPPSAPHSFVDLNGTLLFRANDGVHGEDWWRSDGTAEGTRVVRDLNSTVTGTNRSPQTRTHAVVGGTVFFAGDEAATGTELWKTDGTEEGTVLVKDVAPGVRSSSPGFFVPHGNMLYFAAENRLWKTDGTEAGTVAITPPTGARPLAMLGDRLLYQSGSPGGSELAVTDGTAAGTMLLKDINPGAAGSDPGYSQYNYFPEYLLDRFLVSNGRMYFAATTAAHGRELWQTDGTPAGTRLVADINPGANPSLLSHMAEHAGEVYVVALAPTPPNQPTQFGLFRVNADGAGVTPVGTTTDVFPLALTSTGEKLLFLTQSHERTPTLRAMNDAGTGLTEVLRLGWAGKGATAAHLGGATYFMVGDPAVYGGAGHPSGAALWRTDGTAAGTVRLGDFPSSTQGVPYASLVSVGDSLYFPGNGPAGVEPWRSDGTVEGTRLLKDVNAVRTYGSNPTPPVEVNGKWLFGVNDTGTSTSVRRLWATDGTDAGTAPVIDPATGRPFTVHNRSWVGGEDVPTTGVAWDGRLYFAGHTPATGVELFASDGTSAGTTLVADLTPGAGSSQLRDFAVHRGRLFFVADQGNDRVVWSTDGTTAGTHVVKRMLGAGLTVSAGFTALGDALYFVGGLGGGGMELWKTDGTEEGTVLVKDVNPGNPSSDIAWLTVHGGALYFAAHTAANGRELWRSDGTAEGTTLVKDLRTGTTNSWPNGAHPYNLRVVSGRLLFEAYDDASPMIPRLWRTDGTAEGTQPLTAVDFSPDQIGRLNLVEAGGVGYFFRQPSGGKPEMWRTDGTPVGTTLVTVFHTAGSPPTATPVGTHGPTVYVRVTEDRLNWPTKTGPSELWQSDGTEAGTLRLFSGPFAANPSNAVFADGWVLFSADDGVHGTELWRARAARVEGRHVFYNNSVHDGYDRAATPADDAAIDGSKHALLGAVAAGSFRNVTSYSRGINGVMVDLPLTESPDLTADDFVFRAGAGGDPATWTLAPAPLSVTGRQVDSPSPFRRFTITWPDGAIRNNWLQVTVKDNARTGLGRPDVFHFGNLVGETGGGGNGAAPSVTAGDYIAVRARLGTADAGPTRAAWDINRDGRVGAMDLALVRSNLGRTLAEVIPAATAVLSPPARWRPARRPPLDLAR